MFFKTTHKDKKTLARTGVIKTTHGEIKTPVFMPVGTQGTVKSLDSHEIKKIGSQIILSNTYHLHLRPGEKLINKFNGLHKFMNYSGPILTDSGGFQVFSLGKNKNEQGKLVKIDNKGVDFRSHIDGSLHRFTPQKAINIQHKIGADIIMAFDECTPDNADLNYTQKAMERTHKWAEQSLEAHQKNTKHHGYRQYLFGIVQGAKHKKLRQESASFINSLEFDGNAIGGESIGFNMKATSQILDWVIPLLNENKPRYTMGVGYSPRDLFTVVEKGVDMFDCVAPTRIARNGTLYAHKKINKNLRINILNAKYKSDRKPIDPECKCTTCSEYSRAYIHHLFKTQELTAYKLATVHNLTFLLDLMHGIRQAINADRFSQLKSKWE